MTDRIMRICDLCGNEYQQGPHRYDGFAAKLYDMVVCRSCWENNWDGWNQRHEKFLLSRLKEKGLPVPKRNDNGWLPRS